MNAKRFQVTAERICNPPIPVEDFVQAVMELVRVEKDWIPDLPETSLYMRPVCFASEPSVGVRIADEYKFFIMCCPVKNYHSSFSTEDSCWIDTEYVRSVRGSTGAVKAGGNYTGTLLPQILAEGRGYTEVLFLDGVEKKYIEEISASNIMFVIDGKMVTPSLDGSILPGITRDSILYMCREWGIPTEERKISLDELAEALKSGRMTEAISTGTAVVISPVGKFGCEAHGEMIVGDGEVGPISRRLYEHLLAVQRGQVEGPAGWVIEVK
jgi:branched-chain amino acid aminotransferase